MRLDFTFRPLQVIPIPGSRPNPVVSPFTASYSDTLDILHRELRMLAARQIVIQVATSEANIRLDGQIRSGARIGYPGVALSFNSKHGALRYATAEFTRWQDNLRAIALALEALRKVDRYGVSRRGEQYTGWRALPAGTSTPANEDDALAVIGEWCGSDIVMTEEGIRSATKRALIRSHPDSKPPGDRHGTHEAFVAVQAAARFLGVE